MASVLSAQAPTSRRIVSQWPTIDQPTWKRLTAWHERSLGKYPSKHNPGAVVDDTVNLSPVLPEDDARPYRYGFLLDYAGGQSGDSTAIIFHGQTERQTQLLPQKKPPKHYLSAEKGGWLVCLAGRLLVRELNSPIEAPIPIGPTLQKVPLPPGTVLEVFNPGEHWATVVVVTEDHGVVTVGEHP